MSRFLGVWIGVFWLGLGLSHATMVVTDSNPETAVVAPGATLAGQTIKLQCDSCSVVLGDASRLQDVIVLCERPGGATGGHGVVVDGTIGATLERVDIRGCEGDAVHNVGSTGFRYYTGRIRGLQQQWLGDRWARGVHTENAQDTQVMDVLVQTPAEGFVSVNSRGVFVLASRAEGTRKGYGMWFDATSEQGAFIRSRLRFGNATSGQARSDNPSNVWWDSVCEHWEGYVGCVSNQDPPKDWGHPSTVTPRVYTACGNETFQGGAEGELYACEFQDPWAALTVAQGGDIVIVDSKPGGGSWGDVTVGAGVTLLGNQYAQKGTYGKPTVGNVVLHPGARIVNLVVQGTVTQVTE